MKDLCSSYTEKKKKRDVLDIAALTSLKISRALADGKSKTASYFAALGDGFFCGTPERTLGDRIDNNATLRVKSGVRETLGMREDRRAARRQAQSPRTPRAALQRRSSPLSEPFRRKRGTRSAPRGCSTQEPWERACRGLQGAYRAPRGGRRLPCSRSCRHGHREGTPRACSP